MTDVLAVRPLKRWHSLACCHSATHV